MKKLLIILGIVLLIFALQQDNVYSWIGAFDDLKELLKDTVFTGTTTIPTVDINGGTIDATTIGVTTPSTGAFTTLNASTIIGGTATLDTLRIDAGKTVLLPKSGELTDDQFAISLGIKLVAGYGTTAIGEIVYLNNDDSKLEKTNANAAATSADVLVGVVCQAVADNAECLVMLQGTITHDAWNWGTVGAALWLSDTTAGELLATPPDTTNDIVRPVANVIDDDTVYFHGGAAYSTVK